MTETIILENELTPEGFTALFTAVGWTPPMKEQVRAALENSLAVFTARVGDVTAGMLRIVGDGAMTFLIKDLAVAPEYQGSGLGRLLVSTAEDYIRRRLSPGWAATAGRRGCPDLTAISRRCRKGSHGNWICWGSFRLGISLLNPERPAGSLHTAV